MQRQPSTSTPGLFKGGIWELSTESTPRTLRKRSVSSSHQGRKSSTTQLIYSPEKRRPSTSHVHKERPPTDLSNSQDLDPPKSADISKGSASSAEAVQSPFSATDSFTSTTPYSNMLARPGTGYSAPPTGGLPMFAVQQLPQSPTLETITYQHIQETSSKRISTLDYLRKAHEGRVYWFNTLLFNKSDLQRMPYFDSRKLARRATNYLLLGLSIPTVIDLNGSNSQEFLRTLNSLLSEFESFQQIHPPDGSSSSLGRGRFPQMFKRATATGGKGRRQSAAAEIGLPYGNDYSESRSLNGNLSSAGGNGATTFSLGESDLLPGEEYTHLLTPSLPFDPDFYETFATLCDVLIDCYTKTMSLVASPRECNPVVAEMFTKADARVRKIIIQGVVKEFEDSSRAGVKNEIAGVGRVVLGGLM